MCQSEEHQKLFDLVAKMMEYDPAKRLSLEQALRHPFLASYHKRGGSSSGNNNNNNNNSKKSYPHPTTTRRR